MATDTTTTPDKKIDPAGAETPATSGAAPSSTDAAVTFEGTTDQSARMASGPGAVQPTPGADAEAAATTSEDTEALKAQIVDLQGQLDKANARADKAEAKAKAAVTAAPKPAKPRKLGPMDDGLSGSDLADAIAQADATGKAVEIAFSDGTTEIADLAPRQVTGGAWSDRNGQRMLTEAVTVTAPIGGAGLTIAGYALLVDGKQKAWCQRFDPINLGPGQTLSLSNDILF